MECKTDRRGGDLLAAVSKSFQGCFDICEELEECIGFSYSGGSGPGTCYLKKDLEDASENANIDTAYKTSEGPSPSGSASGSTPSSTAAPGKRSCRNLGQNFKGYTVECGTDHYGGDAKAVNAGSFEECFGICDAQSGCVGFAYTGGSGSGTCYTKSVITLGTKNSGVDFAYKPGTLPALKSSYVPAPSSTTPSKTSSSPVVKPEGSSSSVTKPTSSSTPKPSTTLKTTSSTTSLAPAPTNFPECWDTCFKDNGVTSSDQLCDNKDVDKCVKKECKKEHEEQYKDRKERSCKD